MAHKVVTNADIMGRLADMEQGMASLQASQIEFRETQEAHSKRLDVLESRWDWLTDTLGRLLARIGEIGEKTTVLIQRHDALGNKIDNLACSPMRKKGVE